jgi:hypothetical protein
MLFSWYPFLALVLLLLVADICFFLFVLQQSGKKHKRSVEFMGAKTPLRALDA